MDARTKWPQLVADRARRIAALKTGVDAANFCAVEFDGTERDERYRDCIPEIESAIRELQFLPQQPIVPESWNGTEPMPDHRCSHINSFEFYPEFGALVLLEHMDGGWSMWRDPNVGGTVTIHLAQYGSLDEMPADLRLLLGK
ncbi:MAG: hypothetical protein Q7T01_03140 [bacterium]|nr:hypothetical protein [bacterium]